MLKERWSTLLYHIKMFIGIQECHATMYNFKVISRFFFLVTYALFPIDDNLLTTFLSDIVHLIYLRYFSIFSIWLEAMLRQHKIFSYNNNCVTTFVVKKIFDWSFQLITLFTLSAIIKKVNTS